MIFGSRNSILTVFFIAALGLALLFGVNAALILVSSAGGERIVFFESHPFWFTYDITPYGCVSNSIGIALLFILGFASFHFFRVFFKKIGQAEIFFFALFLFSILPEALRLAVLNLHILDLPPPVGIILSRAVLGTRIFGLLCLFFSSLYALNLQYQKFEIIVAVMLLFSFLLTFSVPFDSELLLTDGLFKLSDEQGVFIIYFGLTFFLLINYVIGAVQGRVNAIPLGVLALVIAKEILFFTLSPLSLILGALLFLGGLVVTYKGFESHYALT